MDGLLADRPGPIVIYPLPSNAYLNLSLSHSSSSGLPGIPLANVLLDPRFKMDMPPNNRSWIAPAIPFVLHVRAQPVSVRSCWNMSFRRMDTKLSVTVSLLNASTGNSGPVTWPTVSLSHMAITWGFVHGALNSSIVFIGPLHFCREVKRQNLSKASRWLMIFRGYVYSVCIKFLGRGIFILKSRYTRLYDVSFVYICICSYIILLLYCFSLLSVDSGLCTSINLPHHTSLSYVLLSHRSKC